MSSSQGPYAFYRPGERVERLEDHIVEGLKAIRNYYLAEGYHHYVASRLRALGIEVGPAEVKGALILSYAYHDIAKAAEPYQTNIMNEGGASGHEVVSAYVAYVALSEGPLRLPETLMWASVKAIALHMGAMRESPEQTVSERISKILRRVGRDAFTMSEDVVSWFNGLLECHWHIDELPPPLLPGRELIISMRDLKLFVAKYLSPRLAGRSRFNAEDLATLLLLHPLLVADEVAVAKNTCRGLRRWAEGFIDSVKVARKYRPVKFRCRDCLGEEARSP